MSKEKSTIEERYAAIMELKSGKSRWYVGKKFHISTRTLKYLVYRYDRQGYKGLSYTKTNYYPQSTKISIIQEYERGGIVMEELCLKHNISAKTLKDWLSKYELYKKGDKFALNGSGAIHKAEKYSFNMPQCQAPSIAKNDNMNSKETEKRAERMKELSHMSKKELYELLLDREAEVEFLKKLEALAQERKQRNAMRRE